jgi:hypothetical protein
MSPSPAAEDDAWGTTAASSSCFAVAWRVWILCLLHVVLAFSSVAVAAAVVVLLPFACMAASLCLVCASAALLVAPADGEAERGGSDNDDASSGEEEDHEGEAELEISYFQECTAAYADGAQFTDPRGDEQGQFFWVDAGSYYCYKKVSMHIFCFPCTLAAVFIRIGLLRQLS